jgi:hypothetical protein
VPHHSDSNAAEIVRVLRASGCSVQLIQGANNQAGVPDLLVGHNGRNHLLEVKRPKTGRLSDGQLKFIRDWRGRVAVVTTVDEALRAVGFAV